MSLVKEKAAEGWQSLHVKGAISEEGTIPWAGAMFLPGPAPMAPADLSAWKALRLWAKGSGGAFAVMVYSQSLGFIPRIQALEVGPEWKEFDFPFAKFGVDGHDIIGVLVGAANTPGAFTLQIDGIRLLK